MILLFLIVVFISTGSTLDNGVALTPPMGWLSWEYMQCVATRELCADMPGKCLNEENIKKVANDLVEYGYLKAGYNYLIIDDCWSEMERDENGNLVADKWRFPSGMKALVDYVHSLGLKFGIYQDYGTATCQGYPGLLGHLEQDAKLFGEWEIDYIKIDGCNGYIEDYDEGYPEFGRYLNATGRPIVYSCSWPFYQRGNFDPNYTLIADTCNLWRIYSDIGPYWGQLTDIIEWWGDNQNDFMDIGGPGRWNDPDMLMIGYAGYHTLEQSVSQMALWAVMAAPLLLSQNLSEISPEEKAIAQNPYVIAVNQDPLGVQGKRVMQVLDDNQTVVYEIWMKKLHFVTNGYNSYAIVAFNPYRNESVHVEVPLSKLNLTNPNGYLILDLFNVDNYDPEPKYTFNVVLKEIGSAIIVTADPVEY